MPTQQQLVDALAPIIKEAIARAVAPLKERIAFLEGLQGRSLAEGDASDIMRWRPSASDQQ